MMRLKTTSLLASAIALALTCGQAALADNHEAADAAPAADETAATPSEAPATDAAKATASDAHAASRARAEQRYAEAMADRERRYQDLRERAAEVGLELPETPPWEQDMPQMPAMPRMMDRAPGMPRMAMPPMAMPEMPEMPDMTMPEMPEMPDMAMPDFASPMPMSLAEREESYADLRARAAEMDIQLPETPIWKLSTMEERQAHMEMMRNLTPEQHRALHQLRWETMRARAAEQGMDLPEQAPWETMMEKRAAQKEKYQGYLETVEGLTEEQREAAAAVYGHRRPYSLGMGEMPYRHGMRPHCRTPRMSPYAGRPYDQGRPSFGPRPYPQPMAPYGSQY